MNEPAIAGHIEMPIAYGSVEEVERLLARFGRRSGILIDTDHIRQSGQAQSGVESHGPEADPLHLDVVQSATYLMKQIGT